MNGVIRILGETFTHNKAESLFDNRHGSYREYRNWPAKTRRWVRNVAEFNHITVTSLEDALEGLLCEDLKIMDPILSSCFIFYRNVPDIAIIL